MSGRGGAGGAFGSTLCLLGWVGTLGARVFTQCHSGFRVSLLDRKLVRHETQQNQGACEGVDAVCAIVVCSLPLSLTSLPCMPVCHYYIISLFAANLSLNKLCRFNPYIQKPLLLPATGNPPLTALPAAPSDTNPAKTQQQQAAKTQQQPQHQPPAFSWVPLVPTTSDFYRVS